MTGCTGRMTMLDAITASRAGNVKTASSGATPPRNVPGPRYVLKTIAFIYLFIYLFIVLFSVVEVIAVVLVNMYEPKVMK